MPAEYLDGWPLENISCWWNFLCTLDLLKGLSAQLSQSPVLTGPDKAPVPTLSPAFPPLLFRIEWHAHTHTHTHTHTESPTYSLQPWRWRRCVPPKRQTLPTSTWHNNPRTELTSIINHCESLKSVMKFNVENTEDPWWVSNKIITIYYFYKCWNIVIHYIFFNLVDNLKIAWNATERGRPVTLLCHLNKHYNYLCHHWCFHQGESSCDKSLIILYIMSSFHTLFLCAWRYPVVISAYHCALSCTYNYVT
jgi:hypothetical protein